MQPSSHYLDSPRRRLKVSRLANHLVIQMHSYIASLRASLQVSHRANPCPSCLCSHLPNSYSRANPCPSHLVSLRCSHLANHLYSREHSSISSCAASHLASPCPGHLVRQMRSHLTSHLANPHPSHLISLLCNNPANHQVSPSHSHLVCRRRCCLASLQVIQAHSHLTSL